MCAGSRIRARFGPGGQLRVNRNNRLQLFARTRFAQVEDLVRSHRGFRFRPIQPSLVRELTFAVQRAYAPHRGEAWLPEQAALSELIFADRALGYVRSPQAAEAS